MRRFSGVALVTTCVFAWVPCAMAQDEEKPKGDQPVLRGPAVESRDREANPNASFAPRRDRRAGSSSLAVLGQAIRALRQAPEELRLRDDQAEALRELQTSAARARLAYAAENKAKIERIRGEVGPIADRILSQQGLLPRDQQQRTGGTDRPMRDGMERPEGSREGARMSRDSLTDEQREGLVELRDLIGKAPGADVADKVWAILDDGQERFVRERMERSRRADSRRAERPMADSEDGPMREEGMTDRAPGAAPGRANPDRRERSGLTADREARLLRLFAQLPAETQDRLLERLEGMLEAGELASRRGRPAPSMDSVSVPEPEEKSSR